MDIIQTYQLISEYLALDRRDESYVLTKRE
jgi:hypothetical protein